MSNTKSINGRDMSWKQIEEFSEEENYTITELGNGLIGKSFVVLEHAEKDIVISFILSGYNPASGNIYSCIYSDLK